MNKNFCVIFICFVFILTFFVFARQDNSYKVKEIITPVEIVTDKGTVKISEYDCFDTEFTSKNREFANKLGITEEEAFLFGNLGKYWAEGFLKSRLVNLRKSDLVYQRLSYAERFKYWGFCLKEGEPCYEYGFEKKLQEIRKTKYAVLDTDEDKAYEIDSPEIRGLKHFLVIKKRHLPRHALSKSYMVKEPEPAKNKIHTGKIKLLFADSTVKLKPDRNCNTEICREILKNINMAQNSIDMAIYGYSRTPEIEKALTSAKNRGVKIRLVYDSDTEGKNIYPDTEVIKKLIPGGISDIKSAEAQSIMHNKFYIFDNRILITGSANLSHTDMSGFNSNSMLVIESEEISNIYKAEFEEMFGGKFHNDKKPISNKHINLQGTEINVYFSPKDKSIANGIIPLINQAKRYIYIPTFVLTDKKVTAALIEAKKRGVDVKIIIDALNASVQHSKHKELRAGGILVKTENYAGKMHSKSMIIDDEYIITGSMNFSYSGENKNDENMIVIKNSELAKVYKDFFLYQWSRIDDKWLKLNARAEGKDSIGSCSDGLDNNYDGLTDLEDPACRGK